MTSRSRQTRSPSRAEGCSSRCPAHTWGVLACHPIERSIERVHGQERESSRRLRAECCQRGFLRVENRRATHSSGEWHPHRNVSTFSSLPGNPGHLLSDNPGGEYTCVPLYLGSSSSHNGCGTSLFACSMTEASSVLMKYLTDACASCPTREATRAAALSTAETAGCEHPL